MFPFTLPSAFIYLLVSLRFPLPLYGPNYCSFCLPVVWLLWSSLQPPSPLFLFLSLCLSIRLFLDGLSLSSPPPVVTSVTLQANFTLPEACDFLEAVTFAEVQREEAEVLLKQYNEEGRKAGPPPEKRFDNRQGGFRGRGSGSFQRYDNRDGSRGGYQNRSGDGGSGYRGGKWCKTSLCCIYLDHVKLYDVCHTMFCDLN